MIRALENQKRELLQVIDNERMRTNSLLHDTKDSISLIATERIERAKDEMLSKIRDLERVTIQNRDLIYFFKAETSKHNKHSFKLYTYI